MKTCTCRLPILDLERVGNGDYVLHEPGVGYFVQSFCQENFERLTGLRLRRRQTIKVRITIRPVLTVRR